MFMIISSPLSTFVPLILCPFVPHFTSLTMPVDSIRVSRVISL